MVSTTESINVGDKIPEFRLQDQDSKWLDTKDLLENQNLVIFFYPKDNTAGCTKEACGFQNNLALFNDLDAKVIGISSDDIQSHKNFASKNNLSFTLLSDIKGKVRKQFGVKPDMFGLVDGRTTYIVNKEGVVIHKFSSQLNPTRHIREALKALNQ